MRLAHRVRTLERRAAAGIDCPMCHGEGWPAALIAGAPRDARPPNWPVGCKQCGRISVETWIGIGPDPTPEAARAFLEAV